VTYRVLSLFAGIGGFDLGLERTGGFKTVAVSEINPYASRVLHLRFPDAENVGDVTQAEFPDADAIVAGFPCQDISFAGQGAGLAGARSGLFWEVVRAIRVVRPKHVVLENVAALLSRGLDTVLWALAEVGYDAEWHCIPASAVGAPHRRDRIWIIAHPRSEQHEGGRAPISGEIAAELSCALADAESHGQSLRRAGDEGRNAPAPGVIGLWPELGRDSAGHGTAASPNASGCGQQGPGNVSGEGGQAGQSFGAAWWAVEPDVGRVAHGVPARVDRLKALGNAVVPQIPELIGRAILASEAA
jgi:DNA (cytosine-5)-methyltransferase 1